MLDIKKINIKYATKPNAHTAMGTQLRQQAIFIFFRAPYTSPCSMVSRAYIYVCACVCIYSNYQNNKILTFVAKIIAGIVQIRKQNPQTAQRNVIITAITKTIL